VDRFLFLGGYTNGSILNFRRVPEWFKLDYSGVSESFDFDSAKYIGVNVCLLNESE
jgi:hypothetical protein